MTHSPDCNAKESTLPSDRDLLRRFIYDGDEPSFAAIVERHSSLVMSVCRRVVGQSPDVDDAFQATFFALSQRPVSIYECLSLSGWLYSVAWRASVRLVRLRKRTMTQPLPDQVPASEPDPLDVIAQSNDLASLDEELNQLPQKYRDVLVMSYFAQQTNQEIADQLNESKGAIDGRIRDARRMLRVRLARRGVEVGVLAVAATYMQSSASAASPALIQKAISLGAPGLISQELAALNAAEVAQMKFLTSTGVPLMSKIGLTITAGLVLATGLWGMTKLAAFQDGIAGGGAAAAAVLDATAEDAAKGDDAAVALSGRTEATITDDPFGGNDPKPESSDSAITESISGSNSADGEGETGIAAADGSRMSLAKSPAAKPRRKLTGAAAEFSRRSAREVDERLNEIIQTRPVKNLSFPGENPLTDILKQLSSHITSTYCTDEQRFTILPDLHALNEDSVNLQDVMIMDIELDGIATSSALDLIFRQTDPPLTWIVKDEVVMITTEAAAESDENMFLRSYDISRLQDIFPPQNYSTWPGSGGPQGVMGGMGGGGMGGGGMGGGGMGGGGLGGGGLGGGGLFSAGFAPTQIAGGGIGDGKTSPEKAPSKPENSGPIDEEAPRLQAGFGGWGPNLYDTVQSMSSPPCSWWDTDGEGGRMSIAGNRLLVRQSRKGHEAVVAVLEQLEMAAEDAEADYSVAEGKK